MDAFQPVIFEYIIMAVNDDAVVVLAVNFVKVFPQIGFGEIGLADMEILQVVPKHFIDCGGFVGYRIRAGKNSNFHCELNTVYIKYMSPNIIFQEKLQENH